jgi:hypothetical protein
VKAGVKTTKYTKYTKIPKTCHRWARHHSVAPPAPFFVLFVYFVV